VNYQNSTVQVEL
jgi:hypothetical protein